MLELFVLLTSFALHPDVVHPADEVAKIHEITASFAGAVVTPYVPPAPPPPPAPEPEPEVPEVPDVEPEPVVREDERPAPEPEPSEGNEPATSLQGVWDRVAECESGGNWSINTGNGYYGGVQFSLQSWQAVGGSGYPHEASKAEQIQRAEQLLAIQGWGAWPACSSKLGLR